MKRIAGQLLFFAAIIPQYVFPKYEWVVVSTCVIGFLTQLLIPNGKVFFKILIWELFSYSIMFMLFKNRIFYLDLVVENLGLNKILVPVTFIIFNTLNISLIFYFGYIISNLLLNKSNT